MHPVADGGDGTAELLGRRRGWTAFGGEARDPVGRVVKARFFFCPGTRTAAIDVAEASGLRLLDPRALDGERASSFGTGELVRQALDAGAKTILIGAGGSAVVDGGRGMLEALGARFLDERGLALPAGQSALVALRRIDLADLDPRLWATRLVVLCDVANALLGVEGAIPIYGPQKGLGEQGLEQAEAALANLAHCIRALRDVDISALPRAGAAGGIAGGLHGLLGADLVDGADYFLDATDFDGALAGADYVVTGEGALDDQTMFGKAIFAVGRRARAFDVPVFALSGSVPSQSSATLRGWLTAFQSISSGPCALDEAMRGTGENLERSAEQLARTLACAMRSETRASRGSAQFGDRHA